MGLQKVNLDDLVDNYVKLRITDSNLNFEKAQALAKQAAKKFSTDPMLLSWYQGKTGKFYPDFECGRSDKPAWVLYAESRGGDTAININKGEYIFIYLGLE
jgi:hypothetical protein